MEKPLSPVVFHKAIELVNSVPLQPITVVQRRLINSLLRHAVDAPQSSCWIEISLADLAKEIGYSSRNLAHLKESILSLMQIIFDWNTLSLEDDVEIDASALFPRIKCSRGKLAFQTAEPLQALLKVPSRSVTLDLTVCRKFRRAGTSGLWEFALGNEDKGMTPSVPWQQFRNMLVGKDSGYRTYKSFKDRVLKPSLLEVNGNTDHTISLLEQMSGRRVTEVQLKIRRKDAVDDPSLEDELVSVGVPISEANDLVRKHGAEVIRSALQDATRSDEPRTVAARLRNCLQRERKVDLTGLLAAFQQQRARAYFSRLSDADQKVIQARFGALNGSHDAHAFFLWLGEETWGEPREADLLAFAAGQVASERQ